MAVPSPASYHRPQPRPNLRSYYVPTSHPKVVALWWPLRPASPTMPTLDPLGGAA